MGVARAAAEPEEAGGAALALEPHGPVHRRAADSRACVLAEHPAATAALQHLWGRRQWATSGRGPPPPLPPACCAPPPAGNLLSNLQALALQSLLSASLQYLRLEVGDFSLNYVQVGGVINSINL